jgi:hypothetical protein
MRILTVIAPPVRLWFTRAAVILVALLAAPPTAYASRETAQRDCVNTPIPADGDTPVAVSFPRAGIA